MWQIMIDVSGMPPNDINIGLILFNANYKKRFLYEFYNEFPHLRDYEKKSTRLNSDELFKILGFFNDKKLRMVCYKFQDFQWKKHEQRLNDLFKDINQNHTYRTNFYRFYEKLMGILYYYAITQIGVRNQEYDVVVCHESGLDIWVILGTIKKLAKREGWEIRPSTNIRKIEHLLKMADYVAGANKKIEEFKLNIIERHILLKDPIKDSDLRAIFKIDKRRVIDLNKQKLYK